MPQKALESLGPDVDGSGVGSVRSLSVKEAVQVNDSVEVIDGLYSGYKGPVVKLSGDGSVVTVCMMVYRTPTPLEFFNWMLRKIDPLSRPPKCS